MRVLGVWEALTVHSADEGSERSLRLLQDVISQLREVPEVSSVIPSVLLNRLGTVLGGCCNIEDAPDDSRLDVHEDVVG